MHDSADRNLTLASRNVPYVALARAAEVNVYDVMCCRKLVFIKPAFEKIQQRLAKD